MDPELGNLIRLVMQTLVASMTTDSWHEACRRIVKLVTRRKRREAQSRLDAVRESLRNNALEGPEAVERLTEELGPLLDAQHLTLAQLGGFVSSIKPLIEASKPVITTYTITAERQFNFYSSSRELVKVGESTDELNAGEYVDMLRDTSRALQESAQALQESFAAQRRLTDEVVTQSRLAHESQKEAHAARTTVLGLLVMIAKMRQRLDAVSHERDDLLDQLHEAIGRGAQVVALERQLTATQEEVLRWKVL